MTKRVALAICAFSVAVIMVSLFAGGFLIQKSDQNEIDTSWVGTLTEYLNAAQPYPSPPGDWDLSEHYVYLFQDGEEYLVEYSCGETTLVKFLENLTDSAGTEISATVDKDLVNRITASDKVVSLTYRYPLLFPSRQLNKVWFVLQDNLNEGLSGKLVLFQTIDNKEEVSMWAILN